LQNNTAPLITFPVHADAGDARDTKEIDIALLLFPIAAQVWLESRRVYIAPTTFHEYELNISTLSKFFGRVGLSEITADMIRAYQRKRLATCGPCSINHECTILQQILKRIGRWHDISLHYKRLPLSKEKRGCALEPQEKERLFRVASSNPDWLAAYLFALISVNTTAGPSEVATLRFQDVDLERRVINIQAEGAKNNHRVREIPLNAGGMEALKVAIARAKRLGCSQPHHYLFPYRACGNEHNPERHQSTFRGAWNKIRTAAGMPRLRMYDLRHHAITALLECPSVSDETVEALAGHITAPMKKQYSHVRMKARRDAVGLLDGALQSSAITPGEKAGTTGTASAALTNQDVTEMLKEEIPIEIVSAKIKKSRCNFDTSLPTLKQLRASGVPDDIVLAMVRAS
jgi:integrase